MNKKPLLLISFIVILSSCSLQKTSVSNATPTVLPVEKKYISTIQPTTIEFPPATLTLHVISTSTATLSPTSDSSSQNPINPLTGKPVSSPDYLNYAPALISVSNFPLSVRPQSGLSFAPHVYEMTIGEGMTRFLAVYYGDYGHAEFQDIKLGSIRSGRLPYEQLRNMYDGFIIMAGAAPEVGSVLAATHFREQVDFSTIQKLAEDRTKRKGAPEFGQIEFEAASPQGGEEGIKLEIFWSNLNRVKWAYDSESEKYLREQDKSDASGDFYPTIDKLTGEQLSADNVVVMAAEHDWQTRTRIEMNLLYVIKEPAIFFRDGKAYPVFWTSLSLLGPFRFVNPGGTPFPYKPGNTWFEIIELIQEIKQLDDQSWFVRFINL